MEWSIKSAAVNLEGIEDDNTKIAMDKVFSLCCQNRYDEAIKCLPDIYFEFDASNMDSDPSDYFKQTSYSFRLNTNNNNCHMKRSRELKHNNSLALNYGL
jgi:hypothetical protein